MRTREEIEVSHRISVEKQHKEMLLSDRYITVKVLRYHGVKLHEVGFLLNISKERVRQMQAKASAILRYRDAINDIDTIDEYVKKFKDTERAYKKAGMI